MPQPISSDSSVPDCSRVSATAALVFLVVLVWIEVVPLLTTFIGPALAWMPIPPP